MTLVHAVRHFFRNDLLAVLGAIFIVLLSALSWPWLAADAVRSMVSFW